MSNPTISVIIPTHNRASLLNRTIKSVLNQTFHDFELIIVDDGSTDNTKELINEFKKNDPRVQYIWQENSGRPSETRNTGIKNSKGKYITFLDSDDEILPEKLEKQIKKFNSVSKNVGLIYCGLQYIPENKNKQSKVIIPKLKGNLFKELLKGSFIGGITPLIKKECFQKSGLFDTSLPSGEDWDMWIRISKNYEFDYVPEALAIYHIHGKQISANFDDTINGFQKILEKYSNEICRYPSIYNEHLIRLGIFYCINANIKSGQTYFSKAVEIKPIQINAYLNLILAKIPRFYLFILTSITKRFTLTGYFMDLKTE
jgi:glycosyltransferase involved in cell wall biosynthesis